MQVPLSFERDNKKEAGSKSGIFMGWLSIASIKKQKSKKLSFLC
jgi:hypothetical protein